MKPAYEEVMEWAKEELETGNRVKAAHILRAAEKMKERYENAERERLEQMSCCYY